MANIAASVLARLKTRLLRAAEAISYAYSFSVRKSFFAGWKNPSIKAFLEKPFTVAIERKKIVEQWSAQDSNWKYGGNNNG